MDIATPAGMLLGMLLLIVSVVMAGGVSGIMSFIDIPSGMIVVGGTLAATLVRYPLAKVIGLVGIIMKTIFIKLTPPQEEMHRLVDFAKVARKEGLLALENKVADLKNAFLAKGIQLLVDGTDADGLRSILGSEIDMVRQRHSLGKGILESMGAAAPAFGMLGTLIGLVLMLQNLSDPSKIGGGMATALITTFYGVLVANLFCLPMGGKLGIRSKEETLVKELVLEGIVSIQSGDAPNLVEEKLKSFLAPKERKDKKIEDLKDKIREKQ